MDKEKKGRFLPSKTSRWRTVAVFFIAVVIGFGLFISREAELVSYLSDDPKACVNCHVMTPVYNSWLHSSHRETAVCNDCHTPHNNVLNKYYFKMKDGLIHSTVFTLRREPEVIKMREESIEVVQNNCIRCHTQQVTQTKYESLISSHAHDRTDRLCWTCHREVPHSSIHGISSIKYNISPLPSDKEKNILPKWLQKEMNSK